jgi:hypothetical protein
MNSKVRSPIHRSCRDHSSAWMQTHESVLVIKKSNANGSVYSSDSRGSMAESLVRPISLKKSYGNSSFYRVKTQSTVQVAGTRAPLYT